MKNKTGLTLVTGHPLGYKEAQKNSFIRDVLPGQVSVI